MIEFGLLKYEIIWQSTIDLVLKEEEKGYHNHENKIKKDEEYFHHASNKII